MKKKKYYLYITFIYALGTSNVLGTNNKVPAKKDMGPMTKELLASPGLVSALGDEKQFIEGLFETSYNGQTYIFLDIKHPNSSGRIDSAEYTIVKYLSKTQNIEVVYQDSDIIGLHALDSLDSLKKDAREFLEIAWVKYLKEEMRIQGKSFKKYAEGQLNAKDLSEDSKWVFRQIKLE